MKRISARNSKTLPYSGFTLIELLIVVGIIAIMATLIIAVINPVQLRRAARDSNRKKDLGIMAQALEQYYANNNEYPDAATFADMATILTGGAGEVYIKSINNNQNSSGDPEYCYEINADPTVSKQDYLVCAPLESSAEDNRGDAGDPGLDGDDGCVTDLNYESIGGGYYCVYNPF